MRHEALLYAGEEGFLAATLPFLREGLAGGEPTLVVVEVPKIDRLRCALGPDADAVAFADMADVGDNPARIIPAWQEFVDAHPGRAVRGIGEPVGPERAGAELVECHRHEELLNLAFEDGPEFTLLCPYDTTALEVEVVADAHRTHPLVRLEDTVAESGLYAPPEPVCSTPLEPPAGPITELAFNGASLRELRRFVAAVGEAAGLSGTRLSDLVLATSEVAANSVLYGGGRGVLAAWHTAERVLCEVRDTGRIEDALAGRRRPSLAGQGAYGLWLANQLCDLVQIRPGVVRLHLRLGDA